jgi:ABC-type uncharacterized transport system auxiliary subunit
MTLPGSDTPVTSRYVLSGPGQVCSSTAGDPIAVSVTRANAGLDTERIARRNAQTGEVTYLRGVRWADQATALVEQRLAQDLECGGFTVLSGHRHRLGHQQLVCEIRALNLVDYRDRDEAEVGLSCLFFRAGGESDLPFVSTHRSDLADWSADSAVTAMSRAYQSVLDDLLGVLR